jgi:hypothetical protein
VLDQGLEATDPARRGSGGGPLPITALRMDCLLDALERAYRVLGFDRGDGGGMAGGDHDGQALSSPSSSGQA